MSQLKDQQCVPCKSDSPPLRGAELKELQEQLGEDWEVVDDHHLNKEFKFRDFRQALQFTNLVGELAEEQNHHPDILLAWGKVVITLWTHSIGGLSHSDFVMAAKIQGLPRGDA